MLFVVYRVTFGHLTSTLLTEQLSYKRGFAQCRPLAVDYSGVIRQIIVLDTTEQLAIADAYRAGRYLRETTRSNVRS